jgi:selenocysteine lyase/cysteine desulfurase
VRDFSDPSLSLARFYEFALTADPERLHFAAHSHHLWPDCTRAAQALAWEDAAASADEKWDKVFAQAQAVRGHLARLLGGVDAEQIALAPNTHEFALRLFSCFPPGGRVRVLTTDGEFHSFSRQLRRYEETGLYDVVRVPVEPFETFEARWAEAACAPCDLVYFSHVFFNSGFVVPNLRRWVEAVRSPEAMVVVDGYHALGAVPVTLAGLESRIFYLGGGYKYLQAGEGVCFLYVPKGCELRPANTGWFASFSTLEAAQTGAEVAYDAGGARFAGATMDFTAAYRFNAVQAWWSQIGLTVDTVHRRVHALKKYFAEKIQQADFPELRAEKLLRAGDRLPDGHFVVFRMPDAQAWVERLEARRIIVDSRGDRLRFGFGLYHDTATIDRLITRLGMMG